MKNTRVMVLVLCMLSYGAYNICVNLYENISMGFQVKERTILLFC